MNGECSLKPVILVVPSLGGGGGGGVGGLSGRTEQGAIPKSSSQPTLTGHKALGSQGFGLEARAPGLGPGGRPTEAPAP